MKLPVRSALLFSALFLFAFVLRAEEAKFEVSEFTFAKPEGWKQVEPKSAMRKAQLEIPGKDGGRAADITFFYFPGGQGGDVDSNVKRWLAQFAGGKDAEKVEHVEMGGVKVTLVSTEGTLKASPFAGIPEDQPDSALVGAIMEHEKGPVFIKLTGPVALVKESREKFVAMVKGAAERKK